MSTALEVIRPAALATHRRAPRRCGFSQYRGGIRRPSRKQELAVHIGSLEKACQENPRSADLRTCLGMAYAMNFDVYKSMDALEAAVNLDETHFFAQLKLSELFYRLRALPRAEEETLKAVNLARQRLGAFAGPQAAPGNPQADPRRHAKAGVEQIAEDTGLGPVGDGCRLQHC